MEASLDENAHVMMMDSPTAEQPAQEASQSYPEIPEVSLCPVDSPVLEPRVPRVQREGVRSSSCSLPRVSSSSQLYHQVSKDCPQHSPHPKRCRCCGHRQKTPGTPCPSLRSVTCSPHPDCSSETVRTGHNCSPSHVPSCHDTVHCHWLQGSHDGGTHHPLQHHVVTVSHEGIYRIPRSYSQLIVEFPVAVLISCTIALLGCSLAGILIGPLPDFSDPLLGLEPRGTDIGNRLTAWAKLQENTGPGKPLQVAGKPASRYDRPSCFRL